MRLKPRGHEGAPSWPLKDMLQEAGDECLAIDQRRALAAVIVSANSQAHSRGINADEAFVGDGHAVGVARQVVQHHLGAGQRRLCIHHPVVPREFLHPRLAQPVCVRRIQRQLTGLAGAPQCIEELASEHARERMHREQEGRDILGFTKVFPFTRSIR